MSFFCMQILVVIEPLLIDEDYYARVEGREIISNLAKVRIRCSMLEHLILFVFLSHKLYGLWFVRTILACSASPWSDQG